MAIELINSQNKKDDKQQNDMSNIEAEIELKEEYFESNETNSQTSKKNKPI